MPRRRHRHLDSAPTTIERLRVPMPTDRLPAGWYAVVITAIAFVIRVVNLGYPNKLVFDETYYAKDAYSLLRFGYERNWPESANASDHRRKRRRDARTRVVHRAPAGRQVADRGRRADLRDELLRLAVRFAGLRLAADLVTIRLVRRVSRST